MNTPTDQESLPPARPLQFSLRHIFVALLGLSVLLALVTQLRHIGLIAFCYLAGIVVGWRFRRRRLLAASTTALLVFGIAYLACWAQLGYWPVMDSREYLMTRSELGQIGEALAMYAKTEGSFPDSLGDFTMSEHPELHRNSSGDLADTWGNSFHYQKNSQGYELASLGADGKPGGVGRDADILLGGQVGADAEFLQGGRMNSPELGIPLWQFLFRENGSGIVFNVALIASLAAGAVWYGAQAKENLATHWTVAGVCLTTVSAIVVAVFLAAFYIGASQSGH